MLFLVFIPGCSEKKLKSIELTKDNFSILNTLKLTKVYINAHAVGYGYEYYINDPKKIEVIKICIKDANQVDSAIERVSEKQVDKIKVYGLYFETRKEVYCMRIAWDDKFVYGDWWQSTDLLRAFKKWDLAGEISKADPSWPEPKRRSQVFENGFPGPNRSD